ncbi:hypothetical protein MSAN_01524800 [Mycena sanguinolenta]|uniref:Uncharacterized protein n=1 Tax=Mycena sanguinolenta TaxID=230812 RepID=A0A8H6Y7N7_9AGAR|nr:hypothetical protein MSAN_01524800 [Mycena sanguinolenta]
MIFPYRRDSAPSVLVLKSIFRRIRARTIQSELYFRLRIDGRNKRALDDEEQSLARALTNVDRIEIECRSFESAGTMFPWLALLPALQTLEFRYITKRSGPLFDAQMAQFIDGARDELPRVSEVNMRVVF